MNQPINIKINTKVTTVAKESKVQNFSWFKWQDNSCRYDSFFTVFILAFYSKTTLFKIKSIIIAYITIVNYITSYVGTLTKFPKAITNSSLIIGNILSIKSSILLLVLLVPYDFIHSLGFQGFPHLIGNHHFSLYHISSDIHSFKPK